MTDGDQIIGETERTVFVSYSHADRPNALPIIKALEDAGFSVWWDGLIKGGVHAAKETADVLERARAVVVLWSKNSATSHWVQDEATRGRDRGCLVPISIDGHEPPLGFGQFQFIDVSGKKNAPGSPEMQKMLHAVSALHGDFILPAQTSTQKPPLVTRRNLIIGGSTVVLAGGAIATWASGIFDGGTQTSSMAVLPFVNLSGDPAQTYFSDGLASEIRSELSRNPLLQIVGQTSSNSFRDKQDDAKVIAEKLGVSFLLDGNVQKANGQLKIAADLIDGSTGLSKWAETFERPIADIFAVQAEIAAAVASAMSVAMSNNIQVDKSRQSGGTEDIAAFDAYLRGRDLFELHIDEASERAALAKFDEAIRSDPDYAAPRAARARALAVIANQYVSSSERFRLYDEAIAEAKRATEIAPEFAAGFSALGYALFYGRLDVKGARTPYDKAYSLAKSDVDVFSRYAIYSARTGRFAEADLAIERASALDPLNPSMFKSAGNIKYAAKQYDEAIQFGRRALKLNPERSTVHGDIGNSYLMLGQLDNARREYGLESNSMMTFTGKAILNHRQGRKAQAEQNLDDLVSDHGDNGLYQQAQVLAQWGETGQAFTALAQAQELRDSGLIYLLHDPFLDPIRSDPRFDDLLLKLGFL